ncbi:predicted protein, partial [Nematostella vectensis]
ACFFEVFSDSKLPLLQYRGMMSYSTHKDECNFICDQLISSDNKPVMGFDMEWRVAFASGGGSRKTSLIQLCSSESTCYLFQLSSMALLLKKPSQLNYTILEDETIVKVGVGINSDVDKISREYDVYPRGIVDLSALANTKLKSHENWSLSGLTMHLFKQQLNKDPAIRCSNCEAIPLTREQQLYAAMDAYVSTYITGVDGKQKL